MNEPTSDSPLVPGDGESFTAFVRRYVSVLTAPPVDEGHTSQAEYVNMAAVLPALAGPIIAAWNTHHASHRHPPLSTGN